MGKTNTEMEITMYSTKKRRLSLPIPEPIGAAGKKKVGTTSSSSKRKTDPTDPSPKSHALDKNTASTTKKERPVLAHQRLSKVSLGRNLPVLKQDGATSKTVQSKAQTGMEKRRKASLGKDPQSKQTRTLNALAKKRKLVTKKKKEVSETDSDDQKSGETLKLPSLTLQTDQDTHYHHGDLSQILNRNKPPELLKKPDVSVPIPKTPDIPIPKFARRPSIGIGKPPPEINQLLPPFYGMNVGHRPAEDETADEVDHAPYTLPSINERTISPDMDSTTPPPKPLTTWERMRLPSISEDHYKPKSPRREVAKSVRRQSMVDGLKLIQFNSNINKSKPTNVIRLKKMPVHDMQGNLAGCSRAIRDRNSRRLSLDEVGFEPPENPLGDDRFKKLFGMLTPAPVEHETRNLAAITHGVIHAKRMFKSFVKKPRETTIAE